jgi:hypothetical protein
VEDRLDLVEVAVDPMHGVVLTDVFAQVEEALRHDLQAELLKHLTPDGIPQGLAVILTATGQDKELALFGPDADRQNLIAPQDDRTRGRPDARGCTA